jgi:hypothetical protein
MNSLSQVQFSQLVLDPMGEYLSLLFLVRCSFLFSSLRRDTIQNQTMMTTTPISPGNFNYNLFFSHTGSGWIVGGNDTRQSRLTFPTCLSQIGTLFSD